MKEHRHLLPMTTCACCFHPSHGPVCGAVLIEHQDPAVGGSPDAPLVYCICDEYVQMYDHPDSVGQ